SPSEDPFKLEVEVKDEDLEKIWDFHAIQLPTVPKDQVSELDSKNNSSSKENAETEFWIQQEQAVDKINEELKKQREEESKKIKTEARRRKPSSSARIQLRIHSKPVDFNPLIEDGFQYTEAEKACYQEICYEKKGANRNTEITGEVLLAQLKAAIDGSNSTLLMATLMSEDAKARQALYQSALAAFEALKNLSPDELNQKKYRMALALSIQALSSGKKEDAETLQNYVSRAMAFKKSYFKYGVAAVLILIAAAAFTFATLLTCGVAPVVTLIGLSVAKTAILSGVSYAVGALSSVGLIGLGVYSFLKPSVQPSPNKEMTEFSQKLTTSLKK
ncbi:MAG TPA: hypothetical protein VHM20_01070, partial [Gammaproteobacteria bacterium]|nr:hypothetical protein [Gammaproteobacteria bacterium]